MQINTKIYKYTKIEYSKIFENIDMQESLLEKTLFIISK